MIMSCLRIFFFLKAFVWIFHFCSDFFPALGFVADCKQKNRTPTVFFGVINVLRGSLNENE